MPEITTACWGILHKSPDDVMCASSRMVVKRKDAPHPVVLACTLLAYDARFELGRTLAEAARPVALNHPYLRLVLRAGWRGVQPLEQSSHHRARGCSCYIPVARWNLAETGSNCSVDRRMPACKRDEAPGEYARHLREIASLRSQ